MIVVAPDSYKDCLPSAEVAATLVSAIEEYLPGEKILSLPLADGGEGTTEVLTRAMGGRLAGTIVSDPLGRPVTACFGIAGDTAIVEAAQACGLQRLAPEERNPLRTGSRGLGELLLAARAEGCRHFLVGLGGTATCDGGAGMLSVPGLRDALAGTDMVVLCDVDTPFTGPTGAARVFGPQKGASPEEVELLEERMLRQTARIQRETGRDVTSLPGSGAAGGLGGALTAYFGARLQAGIEAVLDAVGFDALVAGARLVITGEGKSDRQTLSGKAPYGVLRRSGSVPVLLLSGRIEDADALREAGFCALVEVSPRNLPLPTLLRPDQARQHLRAALKRYLDAHGSQLLRLSSL